VKHSFLYFSMAYFVSDMAEVDTVEEISDDGAGGGASEESDGGGAMQRAEGFRMQGKNLYLTYPQNAARKHEVLQNALRMCSEIERPSRFVVVSEEAHADGSPHLHVVIALQQKAHLRGAMGLSRLDGVGGKHGNYQVVKNLRAVVTYIVKDGNYITFPEDLDIAALTLQRRTTKGDKVALALAGGSSLQEVAELEPGFFLLNQRKIREYKMFVESKPVTVEPWDCGRFALKAIGLSGPSHAVAAWIFDNLACVRPFKKKQLFLWGPHDTGKTSLVIALSRHFRVYTMPSEPFYDDYVEGETDLVVCDEYFGQQPVTFMNCFLQGSRMPLRRKGMNPVLKEKNVATIILGNVAPTDLYPNVPAGVREAFVARFVIVHCVSPLFTLIDIVKANKLT